MITVKNMARVVLPDNMKKEVLGMYSHESRSGDFIRNYKYSNGVAYLPLNRDKLETVAHMLDEEIDYQQSLGSELKTPFTLLDSFSLREHQVNPAPALLHYVKIKHYAVLQASCGCGKTCVMTWVAGQLGTKILILVDMGGLISQWQETFQFVWGRDVQVIDRNTTEFSDICIATFQLLHFNPELVASMKNEFGCLLLDEFHTTNSDTRREVIFRMNNYYRIGCTATPYKKGFSDEVLSDLVSYVSVVMEDESALTADVFFVKTGARFYSNNPDDWGKITSKLSKDSQRNRLVAEVANCLCSQGRRVLLIGLTVEMLKEIYKMCTKCKPIVYVGSTTLNQDKQLKDDVSSGKFNLVLSVKKFDKGIDVPSLDALIFAKPTNNQAAVTQLVGRIVRSLPGKPKPVVYDLLDDSSLAEAFSKNRRKWYKRLDYDVEPEFLTSADFC